MVKEEEGFKANVPTKIRKKAHIVPREENGIDLLAVSPFAISVCQKLQDAGYKAFIVGGAVRDLLIGAKPKDFDVATDATPEEVKKSQDAPSLSEDDSALFMSTRAPRRLKWRLSAALLSKA